MKNTIKDGLLKIKNYTHQKTQLSKLKRQIAG